jgi:hypothetical protein
MTTELLTRAEVLHAVEVNWNAGPDALTDAIMAAMRRPAPRSSKDGARLLARKIIAASWADRGFPNNAEQIANGDVWVIDAMLAFAEALAATTDAERSASRLARFKEAVANLDFVKAALDSGHQFNAYAAHDVDDEDFEHDSNREDQDMIVAIGPITNYLLISYVEGLNHAEMIASALQYAALAHAAGSDDYQSVGFLTYNEQGGDEEFFPSALTEGDLAAGCTQKEVFVKVGR